jgi:beta-glucanase (GH16 family)
MSTPSFHGSSTRPDAIRRLGVIAVVSALVLPACGGGGGGSGNPPVASPPPAPQQPTGPGNPVINEAGGIPAGYQLVWSDEFDVPGLPDASRWSYDIDRNSAGWYNNELQYYGNARPENSQVENGLLVITARREDLSTAGLSDWGGQQYSSARLVTRDRIGWTRGFFEIRAKLPCGRGTWPAIWTLSSPPQSAWPDDGEIDIMEHVGFDAGVIHGTVHTGAYNHSRGNHRNNRITIPDVCAEFHKYQLHWTANRITVGVDDRYYFQYSNDGTGNPSWPFDSPQYLILNIAIGGDWGGQQGVDDAIFPVRMEIDYVRIYQAAG